MPDPCVKRALQQLPGNFRTAVYLADVEGYTYREIAGIMRTPIGTMMSRLHRPADSCATCSRTALPRAVRPRCPPIGGVPDGPGHGDRRPQGPA